MARDFGIVLRQPSVTHDITINAGRGRFIPRSSTGLITSDAKNFYCASVPNQYDIRLADSVMAFDVYLDPVSARLYARR